MKRCNNCNAEQDVTIRMIFSKTLVIKNVPVYSCENCNNNEVVAQDKAILKRLILNEGAKKEKKVIFFEQYSEFAQLLLIAINEQNHPISDNNTIYEIMKLLENYSIDEYDKEMYWDDEVKKIVKLLH